MAFVYVVSVFGCFCDFMGRSEVCFELGFHFCSCEVCNLMGFYQILVEIVIVIVIVKFLKV